MGGYCVLLTVFVANAAYILKARLEEKLSANWQNGLLFSALVPLIFCCEVFTKLFRKALAEGEGENTEKSYN